MADQSWAMTGELVLSCNCTVFCPCVLSLGGHPPTEGYCQTWAGLRVDHGHFGDVDLSGLNLGLVLEIPGYMSRGNLSVVVAAMSMSVLPVVLLFLLAQKFVIEGIAMSGIKN